MEYQNVGVSFADYEEALNSAILSPEIQVLTRLFNTLTQDINQVQYDNKGLFFSRVKRNSLVAKRTILSDLMSHYLILQQSQRNIFKQKIKSLALPVELFVRDGIIAMYSDLSELSHTCQKNLQQNLNNLIQKCQKSLHPLLKDHFILKQLHKTSMPIVSQWVNTSVHSLQNIQSQKVLGCGLSLTSLEMGISEKSLGEEHDDLLEGRSIQELVQEELRGQQNSAEQAYDTCRICGDEFKIIFLHCHVRYCSRIETNKAKRYQLIEKQRKIVQEMKREIIRDSVIFQSNQDDCFQVNKVYNTIINTFERTQRNKKQRRGSFALSEKSQKSAKSQRSMQIEIDEFLNQNSQNQLLEQFKQLQMQRTFIEKKLQSLQATYQSFHRQKQSPESPIDLQSFPSTQQSRTIRPRKPTKKSIFARKSSSIESSEQQFGQHLKRWCYPPQNTWKESPPLQVATDPETEGLGVGGMGVKGRARHRSLTSLQAGEEVGVRDFQVIKFLGKGAFGRVYMVRRKNMGDIYALKVIKVGENLSQGELESIKKQHQVLSQIGGDYLVKAPFSFTEGGCHFFVLQYMPGGNLSQMIEQQVYLNMQEAKHYLAEIVLAIEHLHSYSIIHRDLKPENLIFDSKGHLKLTDFGLSQPRISSKIQKLPESLPQKLDTKFPTFLTPKIRIIGTPDYIAPEVLSQSSLDNPTIDWWSLGVIAYEMMVGCRPFSANTIEQIVQNIQNFNIQWPQIGDEQQMIPQVAADFIALLLQRDFGQRLGAKGADQVKAHPFFEGVKWDEVKTRKPPLMRHMDFKQKYEFCPEDPEMRRQIISQMSNVRSKSRFGLDNFIRYDILVEQTLQSADNQIIRRSARIKRLKSLVSSMSISSEDLDREDRDISDKSQKSQKSSKSRKGSGSEEDKFWGFELETN